jgi:hypothetical protein
MGATLITTCALQPFVDSRLTSQPPFEICFDTLKGSAVSNYHFWFKCDLSLWTGFVVDFA